MKILKLTGKSFNFEWLVSWKYLIEVVAVDKSHCLGLREVILILPSLRLFGDQLYLSSMPIVFLVPANFISPICQFLISTGHICHLCQLS